MLTPDVALSRGAAAPLPKPLKRPPLWSSHLAGAHERHAFDQAGRVAKLALKKAEGSVALPSGADPRTEQSETQCLCSQGADPRTEQQRKGADPRTGSLNAKSETILVSCFLPVLAGCAGVFFLDSGRRFSCPGPCVFLSVFLPSFLAVGVMFQLPAGWTSGQTHVRRPKNWPFQVSSFTLYVLTWGSPTALPLS